MLIKRLTRLKKYKEDSKIFVVLLAVQLGNRRKRSSSSSSFMAFCRAREPA